MKNNIINKNMEIKNMNIFTLNAVIDDINNGQRNVEDLPIVNYYKDKHMRWLDVIKNSNISVEKSTEEWNKRESLPYIQKQILKANEAYYNNNGKSTLTDFEYDNLMERCRVLETINEIPKVDRISTKIGAISRDKNFERVKHETPMLSLGNTYNKEEILLWEKRTIKKLKELGVYDGEPLVYTVEPKYDGVAIEMIYENGNLVQAITRGDGTYGDDVTANTQMIENVPEKITTADRITFRGEIMASKKKFEFINDIMSSSGLKRYANPRNFTSGSIKLVNPTMLLNRGLMVNIFEVVGSNQKYRVDMMKDIHKFTGTYVEYYISSSIDKVIELLDIIDKNRDKRDYDIDGAVIKLNSIKYAKALGASSKSPNWAIAYKYATEQVTTRLLDVTWQVGRTGILTPVAELEPVQVSGTMVARSTLHNLEQIRRKDLMIGDVVVVEKAAEIIPQVVEPLVSERDGSQITINVPNQCPICGAPVIATTDIAYSCSSPKCPAKLQGAIEHFVQREAMDIQGLGNKIIAKLINKGLLTSIKDIYTLKDKSDELDSMLGKKVTTKILGSIEQSKNKNFNNKLYALAVPNLGRFLSLKLANICGSLDNLISTGIEKLTSIEGVASTVGEGIVNYFKDDYNMDNINAMKDAGIEFEYIREDELEVDTNGVLTDKYFHITGSFKGKDISRKELELLIKKHNGKLTKKWEGYETLITGDKPTERKVKSAKYHNCDIMTVEEMLERLK